MKTILLKFAGPLQSWGTNSRFANRSTDRHPSKSAVLGMLAASLGYSRDEARIERLNQLDYAVRVDQPGELLNDYHVARRLKPDGRADQVYVTNRQYLQDAIFVVALGSKDEQWITDIEWALRHPYFQPFLGRRCNPLTADSLIGTQSKNVITSLENLEWQASDWYRRKCAGNVVLSIYADAHLIVGDCPRRMVRDRVISFSQRERLHGYRAVGRKDTVVGPSGELNHDAFDAF